MGLQEGARSVSEGNGKVSGCGSEGSSGLNLMRFNVYKVTFVFFLILNLFFLWVVWWDTQGRSIWTCWQLALSSRECEEDVWGVFINHTV